MTAQLQHGVERFRCRAVRQAGGQVVPPLLKLIQHVRQRLHRVSPPFRSTAPIGRPTVSDNHRRLRRRSRGSSLAPRPVGRGSLGGGRGAIAAGWWSWHPGLISRDASRVQWTRRVGRGLSAGQRWPNLRCYRNNVALRMNRRSTSVKDPVSCALMSGLSRGTRRWPSWVCAYVSGTNLSGVLEGTRLLTVLPELFLTTVFPITLFSASCRISRAYAPAAYRLAPERHAAASAAAATRPFAR